MAKSLTISKPSDEQTRRLASLLFQWEASLNSNPSSALCQRGLDHSKQALQRLAAIRTTYRADHVSEITNRLMSEYESCKESSTHRERRKRLEDIIRLLQPMEAKEDLRILVLLAKAYLHRSLLFKPRSFGVPAGKIEALNKMILLADRVLQKDSSHAEALKLWILAALELEKFTGKTKTGMDDYLKRAADYFSSLSDKAEFNDLLIVIEHAERTGAPDFLRLILHPKVQHEPSYDLSLLCARACLAVNKTDEAEKHMQSALDNAPNAIADPFWHDLFRFLMRLKEKNMPSWRKWSLSAWEKIKGIEVEISSNIFLNWYWADKKKLYDLAFVSAEAVQQKMVIADSLKSRPSARYAVLDSLKSDKTIQDFLESDYEVRDRRYIKRIHRGTETQQKKLKQKIVISSDQLPEPWVAVHFYLDESNRGWAMIFDSQKKEWKEQQFNYRQLYKCFIEWQEAYIKMGELSGDILRDLCLEIGLTMPFLFDKDLIPDERPVLWIPFGFLHRLPLHAAIHEQTNEVFLSKHTSRYLPAWSMAHDAEGNHSNSNCFIKKYEEHDFDGLRSLKWDVTRDPAAPKDIRDSIEKNPAVLMILCHGSADMTNPFRSHLILEGSDMTLHDLLKTRSRFSGARIFLGACESDMATPIKQPMDEHLSLGTACLSLNASEVIAGLWKVADNKVEEFYGNILSGNDMAESLRECQCPYIEEKPHEFFDVIPFRVMGFPHFIQDHKEQ